METRKLYYEDPLCREFSARVTGCVQAQRGWEISLDATAFYPEGGGQACDTGTLGLVRVMETREREGQILHLCDGPLEPGPAVEGKLDWERRLDLQQQHSGEHIVSGIVHRRFGYHNVGFHVGKEVMQIDFDGPIREEELAGIEEEANRAVWENREVKCWYPSREELPEIFYRTKKELPWPVRIVQVPGYDSCACCGVHVKYTGQIGLIKLISCVKFHQGVRIELVCGRRAWNLVSRVFEQNRQVSQCFSAKMLETGEAARKMNDTLAAREYRIGELEKKLAEGIAESYVNYGNVLHFEPGLNGGALRELADRIAEKCGGRAAVFSGTDGNGYSYCLAIREGDLRQLGKELNTALNGRGGGKPNFQQGSVRATRREIEEFFVK